MEVLTELPRHRIMGVSVNAVTVRQLYAAVEEGVASRARRIIGHHNLHSVYLFQRHAGMRAYYALADLTFMDGMSLVVAGRTLGLPLTRDHRMTSIDWLVPLLRTAAARGWNVFFLGSAPGVAEAAVAKFTREAPGLRAHVHSGYFDATPGSAENEALLAHIQDSRADLLLVGMGMPRQEEWILGNHQRISAPVIMSLGAFMDYHAGVLPTPPRWLSRIGLEWACRLAAEPRRMFTRYMVEPWTLLPLLLRDLRASHRRRG